MRRAALLAGLLVGAFAVAPALGLRSRERALPLLHQSSLAYIGAFRLPPAEDGRRTFDYGATALAYSPVRRIGGAAYDPARRLLYVSPQYADGAAPLIEVFRVR